MVCMVMTAYNAPNLIDSAVVSIDLPQSFKSTRWGFRKRI